jgi:uncharacterized membrane protein YfhO
MFLVLSFSMLLWFFMSGKTLIWTGDGWLQHYRAYQYYGNYIRSVIAGLWTEHRLVLPAWDFSIGEGADILSTLHYYVLGDPFAFFAFLCPSAYMYWYYGIAIFARLYVAGLAFRSLCYYTLQQKGSLTEETTVHFGILAGSLSYVFCYWCVINIQRHPFFLNPMIYLPLLILGVEKILREKKPCYMCFAVMFAALSNFYFFYMLVILTVIYVVFRLAMMPNVTKKEAISGFLGVFAASFTGVLMAGAVFYPVAMTFLEDARMNVSTTYHLFYPLLYYSRLAGTFVSAGGTYAMFMGFSAPVLLAVLLLFRKRGHKTLKALWGICLLFVVFPVFGQILNGFSYMTNRWCFALALVACYSLSALWKELFSLTAREVFRLLTWVLIYGLLCFFLEYSRTARVYEAIVLALAGIFLLLPLSEAETGWSMNARQWGMTVIVALSAFCLFFNKYVYGGSNYLSESVEVSDLTGLIENETTAVKEKAAGDTSFFRYGGKSLSLNGNISSGLSSAVYYWTLSNPYVAEFRQIMHLPDANSFNYNGYDDRSVLNTLSAVKYYVTTESAPGLPEGYSDMESYDIGGQAYQVAINDQALPLAYLYQNTIARQDWDSLDFLEKQEALLQAAVVETREDQQETENFTLELTSQEITYEITGDSKYVSIQDHALVVTKENASVTLTFAGLPDAETYLDFEGLKLQITSDYDRYFSEEADPEDIFSIKKWNQLSHSTQQDYYMQDLFGEAVEYANVTVRSYAGEEQLKKKNLMVFTEDYNHYDGRGEYALMVGQSQHGLTSVTLTFGEAGIYSFDSMKIYCQPMGTYRNLGENIMAAQEVSVGSDEICVQVTAQGNETLVLAVPYATGWSATVDGKTETVQRINVMYMGVSLTTGRHQVVLTYRNPYIRLGFYVSLVGWGLFALGAVWRKHEKNKD